MKLSIIIINYNVEHFLEQCLYSVSKASRNISSQIFIVDNNSVDGSVEMVRQKFPQVQLIENKKNEGFSFANNQAIRISQGDYILLLNPDTVVEEDTFEKTVKFMDEHPEAAGLGVKMLDGKGNFLPESKRGLPTPATAFYKISGLSRLFPKSRIFNKYHLGFLDKDQIHEVDILSGAFMLLRRNVLEKIGLLDESFFMYGEDIDISYRIIQAGYKNYYFSNARIIHYKGESTKRSSINYVFVFYNAMIIFAKKHFSKKNAKFFSFFINIAIYLRATAAIVSRVAKKITVPFLDSAIIFFGLILIKNYYGQNINVAYSEQLINIAFPFYIAIWLLSVFFSGGYDKPLKIYKILRGIIVGTAIILIIYSLLPETYRFSRAIIILGAIWAAISLIALRGVLHLFKIKGYSLKSNEKKRIVIVGEDVECRRVLSLLTQTSANNSFVGFVDSIDQEKKMENYIGSFKQLKEIIQIYAIDEVIFCARDLSSQKIIDQMSLLGNTEVDFKIAPPESLSIIGSNSIETAGDLYIIDINSINKAVNMRNKRVLDIFICLVLTCLLPILLFVVKKPIRFLNNIFYVLFGHKSWVGYANRYESNGVKLPGIKPGVLSPWDAIVEKNSLPSIESRLNLMYAKDYKVYNDLNIIRKGYIKLGN